MFPKTMTEYGHVLENDAIVVVKGRVDLRDDAPKIVAMEVIRPEIVLEGGPPVRIKVKLNALSDDKAARLKGILAEHPGDSPVYVHLEAPGEDHRAPPRRRRTSSTPATASSPSSASSSAPTASPDHSLALCEPGYPARGRSLPGEQLAALVAASPRFMGA